MSQAARAGRAALRRLRGLAGLCLALGALACNSAAADVAQGLRELTTQPDHTLALRPAERAALAQLYPASTPQPLWVDADGRPTLDASDALTLLADAGADGLDPADYRADVLAAMAAQLSEAEAPPEAAVAAFDVATSVAMWRFLHDLNRGRVAPDAIGFRIPSRPEGPDFAALLRSALAQRGLADAVRAVRPALAQYAHLRRALAHYRTLAAIPALQQPLPRPAASVRPGQPYAGLAALRERLMAFGDLAPGEAPTNGGLLYDGALVDALQRFQQRHGLGPDGVLGPATVAALSVPASQRAHQIALALERLRWLPPLADRRLVTVNLPMFHLWTSDAAPGGGLPPAMRVIVGRALSTQTPPFIADMTHLVFRPYWNLPRSIVRNEILPALANDPYYLERNDMEIVHGLGSASRPVPTSAENVALLAQGALRLRQRPGPRNSLGLVKFVLPNDEAIYLHDTPVQQLFGRPRRDFSHGCVRLEQPQALAEWALRDQPQWTPERIAEAMSGTQPQRVDFTEPIRVLLFYATAAVLPDDGRLHFARDIYRYDAKLDRALAARHLR